MKIKDADNNCGENNTLVIDSLEDEGELVAFVQVRNSRYIESDDWTDNYKHQITIWLTKQQLCDLASEALRLAGDAQ